jgi:hypothetical protein
MSKKVVQALSLNDRQMPICGCWADACKLMPVEAEPTLMKGKHQ